MLIENGGQHIRCDIKCWYDIYMLISVANMVSGQTLFQSILSSCNFNFLALSMFTKLTTLMLAFVPIWTVRWAYDEIMKWICQTSKRITTFLEWCSYERIPLHMIKLCTLAVLRADHICNGKDDDDDEKYRRKKNYIKSRLILFNIDFGFLELSPSCSFALRWEKKKYNWNE